MGRGDRLEVWIGDSLRWSFISSHAPAVGEFINVKKKTYRVVARTWALDHVESSHDLAVVRCNITVEPCD